MRAMQLQQTASIDSSPLVMAELQDPQPGWGQVRVKVRCCAICRTDLHVIEGELEEKQLPVIPGHQAVGIIDRVGPGCDGPPALGARVGVAWLGWTCGECEYCQSGRENLCGEAKFTGYHLPGGYADYVIADARFVYELPAVFPDVEAAPLLCAGIIGYRALLRAKPRPGCRLALYGFGSSAHVTMQIAQQRGYEVFVATRGEKHRQLAQEMGAAWVGENASQMPRSVDSAIIFAPAGELVPAALQKLNKGGTLVLAGIHMSAIPSMDYRQHLFYERDIRSTTCNTREDGKELLAEAARAPIRPRVTTYPLDQANRALQDLKHDRINGTGILLMQ